MCLSVKVRVCDCVHVAAWSCRTADQDLGEFHMHDPFRRIIGISDVGKVGGDQCCSILKSVRKVSEERPLRMCQLMEDTEGRQSIGMARRNFF